MNKLYDETRLEMAQRLSSAARVIVGGEPEEQERAWAAAEQSLLESEPERLARFGDAGWRHGDDDERRSA